MGRYGYGVGDAYNQPHTRPIPIFSLPAPYPFFLIFHTSTHD